MKQEQQREESLREISDIEKAVSLAKLYLRDQVKRPGILRAQLSRLISEIERLPAQDQEVKTLQEQRTAEEVYMNTQQKYPAQFGAYTLPEAWQIEAMELYANQFKSQSTQEWISVNHLLPEYNVNVLVIGEQKGMNPQMGGGYVSIAMRKDLRKTILFKEKEKYQCENGFGMMNYVTHWMPLPEKPKS